MGSTEHYLDLAHDLLHAYECGRKYKDMAAERQWSSSKVRHYVRIARLLSPETEALCYRNEALSVGHAKLLASHSPSAQIRLARDVLAKGWSVHQLERRLKGQSEKPPSAYYERLSETLSEQLGHPLTVAPRGDSNQKGSITFTYSSLDDFDALCARLGLSPGE